MTDVKQLILVRNDLRSKLRAGKLSAQVAHASVAACLQGRSIIRTDPYGQDCSLIVKLNKYSQAWFEGAFTKIVLRVDDLQAMMNYKQELDRISIPNALITDAGRTVFNEPTTTCLGVGPWDSSHLDEMFGDLKMY